MKKTFVILAAVLFTIPAISQTNSEAFCKVGSIKKGKTTYESVYTNKQRTEAIQEALSILIRENKKENKTILLYSNKNNTPSSKNLADKKVRENKDLLGGIEKTKKGDYYMLLYITDGMALHRQKMN